MRLPFGIGSSVLVVFASVPLIAALNPPQAAAPAAPAQTATPAPAAAPAPAGAGRVSLPPGVTLEAPPELQKPDLPSWAYTPVVPRTGPAPARTPDDGTVLHVPNSTVGYTKTQLAALPGPPDWHPDNHPSAPKIVTEGRNGKLFACGYCHLPNGYGRPENEGIAGLPAGYIVEQFADFKANKRHSSVPNMGVITMIPVAVETTPEELKEAAAYFASIKRTKWIKVVEADTVPKAHPNGRMMVADAAGGTEPIGERVLEIPENLEATELRDSASQFIAYAPVGSLKKGEDLVKNGGGGKTMACTMCHGADLKGVGDIPPINGRSPSALGRQLFDFQTGARNGVNAPLMKPVVANLKNADIVAITAYLASLEP